MSKHRIILRTVTISEIGHLDGWLYREQGIKYKTAIGAFMGIRRRFTSMAKDCPDAVIVTVVSWVPRTSAGRLLVQAITDRS